MKLRRILILGAILASIFGGAAGAVRAGLVWNHSPSLPLRLYQTHRDHLSRGDLVLACLPDTMAAFGRTRGYLRAGLCTNPIEPVGKRLAERRKCWKMTSPRPYVSRLPSLPCSPLAR
jgi:type IV secretory pathway protease TraF